MLGEKLLEMAGRVNVVDRIAEGAVATYAFDLDGVVYSCTLTVARRGGGGSEG